MKRININLFLYIFVFLCVTTGVIDYLSYIFDLNYFIGLGISLVITGGIAFLTRKHVKIVNDFSKSDIVFFVLLFLVCAITIVFPDRMTDTLNYHLYSQEHPFNRLLNGDFFPSRNINSYTYSLTDRVFYPFRFLLGYRLGLLFNYFLIVVIYYQAKELMKNIGVKNTLVISVISSLSIFSLSIIDLIDCYYADYFSIITMLAILNNVITKKDVNINALLIYIALLSGICFSAKIANMYFIFALIILFIINYFKDIKKIKFRYIIPIICAFLFPFIVYMIYTYLDTGNPVFPFYNTIFHSKYYPNSDWMDLQFGPKTIKQLLAWPYIAVKYPRLSGEVSIIEPMCLYGYLCSMLYIARGLICIIRKKEYSKSKFLLAIFCFVSYIIWGIFVIGYLRYALFLLIIGGILFGLLIIDIFKMKKYVFIPIVVLMLMYNSYYVVDKYIHSYYFSYNNIFANGIDSYKYNLSKLFTRKEMHIYFPDKSAWGVIHVNSGYMMMLNDDIPIYSIFDREKAEEAERVLANYLSDKEHIYTIMDGVETQQFMNNINATDYTVKDVYGVYKPNYVNYDNLIYVLELEKQSKDKKIFNQSRYFYRMGLYKNVKSVRITGFMGLDRKATLYNKDYDINLIAVKKDKMIVLKNYKLSKTGDMVKIDEIITNVSSYDDLYLEIVNPDENTKAAVHAINMEVEVIK